MTSNNIITSDDLLGKSVIDVEGQLLGIVEKVLIDAKAVELVGIEVDKGFLRKGLSLGKKYIKRITDHAVFLSIRPAVNVKGMLVFDNQSKKVGVVTKVDLLSNKNTIKKITVQTSWLKKNITLTSEHVDRVGYNVFLKISKKEASELQM